jgi:RNA polymerase sigma factor (sigma-70 family)
MDGIENLIVTHLGLVKNMAAKMDPRNKRPWRYEDLVSVGNVALTQSAQRFDSSKGFAFSTYATPRIQGAMMDFIRDNRFQKRRADKGIRFESLNYKNCSSHIKATTVEVIRGEGDWEELTECLSPEDKKMVLSIVRDGVSQEDTGATMGMTPHTTGRRLRDAYSRLRAQYSEN